MNDTRRKQFAKQALLALWAVFTLVLLSALALVVLDLLHRNIDPLALRASVEPSAPVGSGGEAASDASLSDAPLYFAAPDGAGLLVETQRLPLGDSTVQNCRVALGALVTGPRGALNRILPENSAVRGLYLLANGELVVDFSRELALGLPRSAAAEARMVYGVVNTLCQTALQGRRDVAVKAVRFLVEGAPPEQLFPSHLDYSQPFTPDSRWVAPGGKV